MLMIIASDLDGVIAYTPYKKDDYVPSRLREFYNSCKSTKYSLFGYAEFWGTIILFSAIFSSSPPDVIASV